MPFWKSFFLNLYYHCSRLYRWNYLRKASKEHRVPIMVLFYHRIADDAANSWTTSNKIFDTQIHWLESRFELVSLEEAQRRIRSGVNDQPCVSITFDDGYAENCEQAIPLLIKKQIPCTYFVTVQNITEGEPFSHDLAEGNSIPPNNLEQLRDMVHAGIEIGAHAYRHIDLGQISDEQQLYHEVVTSRERLQKALGQSVRYFAFPFGQYVNLNQRVYPIEELGYHRSSQKEDASILLCARRKRRSLGGCPRIVFAVRSSENCVDKAERAKSPEAQLMLR